MQGGAGYKIERAVEACWVSKVSFFMCRHTHMLSNTDRQTGQMFSDLSSSKQQLDHLFVKAEGRLWWWFLSNKQYVLCVVMHLIGKLQ